ncbi:MAG: spermidine/putrescine ABC transporter substrate-binding protein [Acidimicrobiia bacterium]|nr:spermidine/putrescine ABC transporter substrate-binding protein [Acidimicrobiia bacterium]
MKRLTRLTALLGVGALVLAACGGSDGEDTTTTPGDGATTTQGGGSGDTCAVDQVDGDLNFYNWSEYIDPDLISAFETEYGVDVVEDFYDSNEAMLAQLQAGAVYDLIVPSDYMVGIMIDEGLLAPLQMDALSNIGNLDAQFVNPPYDPTSEYTVAYQWGTTGLGVNLSVVGEDFAPSWALVFDTELTSTYAGGVSLLNDPRETMGAALKYLGYSLNSTSEAELQEAADLIADAKAYITAFDSDQYDENLVNGETAVAHGYSGNFFAAFADTDDPDNWAYIIPEEGGTVWIDNMAVPTVSEHPCTAHTFINYLLDAENGAALTNWNYYASPNAAAEPFILEEVLTDETIYPSDELRQKLEIITDTGDFEIQYNDFYQLARS